MSSEDIWTDPDQPKQHYLAILNHVDDQSVLGEPFGFEAMTDIDAWGIAYQWAEEWCRTAHNKARLLLTGGSISGTRSDVVNPLMLP